MTVQNEPPHEEAVEEPRRTAWGEVRDLFDGGTQVFSALVSGSVALVNRVIGEAVGRVRGAGRGDLALIVFVGGGIFLSVARRYPTVTVIVGAGIWVIAALMHSPGPEPQPKPADQHEPDDEPAAAPDAVPVEEFVQLLHRVSNNGRDNVHLATLAEQLADEYPGQWNVAAIRALCTTAGVPVQPTVRAPGRGPTVGVHKDDLPPLPRAESDTGL